MLEMGTSGLMSGDGKRAAPQAQYSRPSSTLPAPARKLLQRKRRHECRRVRV
jgi:hypothetical protein